MGIFFLVFGIMFLVASIRGKDETGKLLQLLRSDFTGPGNFFLWAISLGGIAAIGYWQQARKFSNLALGLIFIVLIITKKSSDGKDFLTTFIDHLRSTERNTGQ